MVILNVIINFFLQFIAHLKNLRASKKNEKKEEEKLAEGNQQSLAGSNFFDSQAAQSSPGVQMQMSPAQNSQPNQINFNMPQTMNMPSPFGMNPSTFIY